MNKLCTACAAALLLVSCGDGDREQVPATPQQMYERAQELLKPDVKREQSDTAGALRYLQQAAEAGYLPAQTDLGGIYYSGGKGIPADPVLAVKWFTKAAEQGSLPAHVFLGQLLYDGRGVQKDEEAAAEHWRKAADGGIAEAQYRLGRVLAQKGQMSEAVGYLKKAVCEGKHGGVPQAATALGNIYYNGSASVPPDLKAAAHWYALGARGGDPLAQLVYAEMLLIGDPVPKDEAQGLAMLRLAAGQDYAQAIARLINYLRNAPDAAAHEAEAAAWEQRLQKQLDKPRSAGK